jgi:hypothetical protein
MNLQDLASIAEIVGGFAVLATLVYLVIELRDNTRVLKATATNDTTLIWSEWNTMMSQHPDRVLFARSMDPKESLENFDPTEQVTLDFLGRGVLQKWAAGFYQYEAGILDAEQWDNWISWCHSMLALPVWAAWWSDERKAPVHSQRFLAAVDSAHVVKLNIGQSMYR